MILFSRAGAQETLRRKNALPSKPVYGPDHDSSYYQSFERNITARLYVSRKYTGFELEKNPGISRFRYVPHMALSAGVEGIYKSVSLNIGYSLGFLNRDPVKGKTRYLDLQTHVYARKWITDITAQWYKGYYLSSQGLAAGSSKSYYVRPDLRTLLLGVSAYHLLNPAQFSFRAVLMNDEVQKKSAGSVLIGAELYYGLVRADSSMIPLALSAAFGQKDVRKLFFIKIGPGIGYAYTYVFPQGYYLSGSLCASLSVDFSKQYGTDSSTAQADINKGFIYRLVVGYDRHDWSVSLSLVGNQMTVAGTRQGNKYNFSAGDFRVTLARRIRPGKKLAKTLRPVDQVIENIKVLNPSKP